MKVPVLKMPKLALPKIPLAWGGMGVKKKQILLLEIGEEFLKLAAVNALGEDRKILSIGIENVKGLSELDISLKIIDFLKKIGFKANEAVLAHPTHNLTTRILILPSTDPKEIKDIIELQAVKQTPYARDEITAGFTVLSQDASGYSQVLLAISHRDVASRYFRIAELAGLSTDKIVLSLNGAEHWLRAVYGKEAKEKGQNVLFLDLDALSTDLFMFAQEKLVFTRTITVGAKHLAEQAAMMEPEFLKEIQRSLEAGSADMGNQKITHMVLTGNGDSVKNAAALLTRELNLPCEGIANFRDLDKKVLDKAEEALKKANLSVAGLVGLALWPEAAKINLTPPEIQIRKGLEERARDLGVMATLLLAFVTLVSITGFEKIYKLNQYSNILQKEYEGIRTEAQEAERLVAKMKLADEQMNASGNFLDVLHDINGVIPDTIYLTSLQFHEGDKRISIRGISDEMSGVFQFLSTLEATPGLQSVETKNASKRKVGDQDKAEFEIIATVGFMPGGGL